MGAIFQYGGSAQILNDLNNLNSLNPPFYIMANKALFLNIT